MHTPLLLHSEHLRSSNSLVSSADKSFTSSILQMLCVDNMKISKNIQI